jgi:hypothetical protein
MQKTVLDFKKNTFGKNAIFLERPQNLRVIGESRYINIYLDRK